MYPRAGIAGGFLGTLGILSLTAPAPLPWAANVSASSAPVVQITDVVDRTHKGDRLRGAEAVGRSDPSGAVIGGRNNASRKSPVRTIRQGDKERHLEGCEPLVSPLASASLSRLVGRCIAETERGQKLAMATD
jgi:hypothetical protein